MQLFALTYIATIRNNIMQAHSRVCAYATLASTSERYVTCVTEAEETVASTFGSPPLTERTAGALYALQAASPTYSEAAVHHGGSRGIEHAGVIRAIQAPAPCRFRTQISTKHVQACNCALHVRF
jgi:hypothetical protein